MNAVLRRLLWIDAAAGCIAGALLLALHRFGPDWLGLPAELILFEGIINGLYATGAFLLARSRSRRETHIAALALANLFWAGICLALAIAFRDTVTALGLLHLLGGALFVAALGLTEWQCRQQLARPAA